MNTEARIEEVKARIAAKRAATSCLTWFPQIQKIINEANALKDARVREEAMEIIRCGLENADDTATEAEYAAESVRFESFRQDFPSRARYWEYMFFASAASASCEPRYLFGRRTLKGHTVRWLKARNLHG